MNSWIVNGSYYTGWNNTIGDRQWSRHFDVGRWGWNAGTDGRTRLASEFAQALRSWDVTDEQVDGWVDWYKRDVVPVHGEYDLDDPAVLKGHSELPQGISVGKDDVHGQDDPRLGGLKRRIRAGAA